MEIDFLVNLIEFKFNYDKTTNQIIDFFKLPNGNFDLKSRIKYDIEIKNYKVADNPMEILPVLSVHTLMLNIIGYFYNCQLSNRSFIFPISIATQFMHWKNHTKKDEKDENNSYENYFILESNLNLHVPQHKFLDPSKKHYVASCGESCLMNIFNSLLVQSNIINTQNVPQEYRNCEIIKYYISHEGNTIDKLLMQENFNKFCELTFNLPNVSYAQKGYEINPTEDNYTSLICDMLNIKNTQKLVDLLLLLNKEFKTSKIPIMDGKTLMYDNIKYDFSYSHCESSQLINNKDEYLNKLINSEYINHVIIYYTNKLLLSEFRWHQNYINAMKIFINPVILKDTIKREIERYIFPDIFLGIPNKLWYDFIVTAQTIYNNNDMILYKLYYLYFIDKEEFNKVCLNEILDTDKDGLISIYINNEITDDSCDWIFALIEKSPNNKYELIYAFDDFNLKNILVFRESIYKLVIDPPDNASMLVNKLDLIKFPQTLEHLSLRCHISEKLIQKLNKESPLLNTISIYGDSDSDVLFLDLRNLRNLKICNFNIYERRAFNTYERGNFNIGVPDTTEVLNINCTSFNILNKHPLNNLKTIFFGINNNNGINENINIFYAPNLHDLHIKNNIEYSSYYRKNQCDKIINLNNKYIENVFLESNVIFPETLKIKNITFTSKYTDDLRLFKFPLVSNVIIEFLADYELPENVLRNFNVIENVFMRAPEHVPGFGWF